MTINFNKYKPKSYLHFDKRINFKHVYPQISNTKWVEKHAFYPFIHFKLDLKKYTIKPQYSNREARVSRNPKEYKYTKPKERLIFYASHMDSYIYKFYGEKLNKYYTKYVTQVKDIDDEVLAYRDNKRGQNSIHFAKEVFKQILQTDNALIIMMDFTSFFDNLNHKVLKQNLKKVLAVDELPTYWYKLFKSLTKYCYVDKNKLDIFLEEQYGKGYKDKIKNRDITRYMSPEKFREQKKNPAFIGFNPDNDKGVPQGSGMSSVLSNIFMIEADERIKKLISTYNGMYRRYCDDIVLVIPIEDNVDKIALRNTVEENILSIISEYEGLEVQKEKTEIFEYNNNQIYLFNEEQQVDEPRVSKFDYLGFSFDGKRIQLREKSVFKYYSRAYKKIRMVNKYSAKYKKKVYRKSLYQIYTHMGRNYKGYGNFISYAEKAHKEMSELPIESLIYNQIKRHWYKVQKRLI